MKIKRRNKQTKEKLQRRNERTKKQHQQQQQFIMIYKLYLHTTYILHTIIESETLKGPMQNKLHK